MPVSITAEAINRDEVIVTLNVTMKLSEWKLFYQELANGTMATQIKDELQKIFTKIK